MISSIYLASKSPRRQELLTQVGVEFELISVDVPEIVLPNETPEDFVKRVAFEKASAGWESSSRVKDLPVLGADTAVIIDGKILGKPKDKNDAMNMLNLLSGKTHEVLTAIALVHGDDKQTALSKSFVTFRELSQDEIEAYWETGEPKDKAGAYAIQGRGALFIEKLEGSYSGVMGLDLFAFGGIWVRS